MKIRPATHSDLPFILESIVESEKSGDAIFPYSTAFNLNIPEFSQIIMNIFDEEIPEQAWHLEHWHILEDSEGHTAAALSAWIESQNGQKSDFLKAQILKYFLPKEWELAQEKLNILSSVSIPRKNGYVQLEHLYTHPDFRGKGYMKSLIQHVMNAYPDCSYEIQVLKSNVNAVSLYEYMGFSVNDTQCNDDLQRLSLLSGNCKLQLLKNHG